MARVTQARTRQALLVTGDPLDPAVIPERIQLYNELGEPLMIGGGYVRDSLNDSSPVIAAGAYSYRTLEMFPSVRLFKISTNRPARVRIYPTEVHRENDLNRPIGTKPHGDNGRLLEVVTTPDVLLLYLNPTVDITSDEGASSDFFATLNNLDTVSGAVAVTYNYIRTE